MKALKRITGNIPWLLILSYVLMLGTSIHPGNIYLILIFCLVASIYVPFTKIKDGINIWIILFSIIYALVVHLVISVESYALLISYIISPIIFYLCGRYFVTCYNSASQIITFLVISIALLCSMTYYFTVVDIQDVGIVNITRVFEDDKNALAATLYGLAVSLGFAGVTVFFLNKEIGKLNSILLLSCLLLSVLAVVHLVNRTGLAVLLGCFAVCILYSLKGQKGKAFAGIIVVVAIVLYLFINGFIDEKVIDAYISRDSGGGAISGAGGRSFRWLDAIQKLWIYPTGWYNDVFTYRAYVHNLWLDIARVSGVFAFLCFMIVTIRALINLLDLMRNTKSNALVLLIVTLNASFFLSSFVEPVIEGFPLYFYMYLLLWGIQKQVYVDRLRLGISK